MFLSNPVRTQMVDGAVPLRITFIAGTLGRGGTERQMLYMVRSLQEAGCEVRVCSLTRGEFYESELQKHGVETWWVGRHRNPVARVVEIIRKLRPFRPHVLQSMHSFANLYAALPARVLGAISVGALRCDMNLSARDNGRWAKWLIRVPDGLIVNSRQLHRQLIDAGALPADRLYYLANRVDLNFFAVSKRYQTAPIALFIGRLVPDKRLDRFLHSFAIARQDCDLRALVIGDGPERAAMEFLAAELRLTDHVNFLGFRDDLPVWLAQSAMLVLSSDSEGSANVILEAMAAGLPVITTPAGDAQTTVKHARTGYIVPFDDVRAMAQRMVDLAGSTELRNSLGNAGRALTEEHFSLKNLSRNLGSIYADIGRRKRNRRLHQFVCQEPPAAPAHSV